uniref:Fluconazole resistance protein 1 n=1 Tax=Talaromyces marneffei PM1 TaxID=1077442 RepID=A0A093Y461_TALMA
MKSTTSSASSAPASKKLSQFIFTDPISKPLPKRQQVSRACDWCRSLRVKCDNRYPCRNCQTKGRTCNIRGANAAQTCNAAISRIAVLQDRIRDLEQQVEIAKAKIQDDDDDDDDDDDVVGTLINDAADGGNHKTEVKSEPLPSASPHLDQVQRFGEQRRSKHLESIHIQTVHPHQRHCYGRSSSFYFIGRLSSYLGLPPCQLTSDGLMQMDPEAQSLKTPSIQTPCRIHATLPVVMDVPNIEKIICAFADALMPRDYAALRNNIEGIVNIDAAIAGRKSSLASTGKVSDQQAEFRKRLWWTVYALEIKMTLELGRPLALTMSQIPCPPPDRHQDDPYTHQGTNRFTANRHFIQLMLGGRVVYATFQRKCSEALGHDHNNNSSSSIYNNPAALEIVAEAVSAAAAQHFHAWQRELPEPLKTKRLNSGEPLSTDRSALNLKESKNNTPLADGNAVLSVNHAITITNIVYQVLKESNFLAGFHETFQWQWNATLTLIGFIVVFPNGPLTIPARDALVTAIEVFDIIGKYIGIACSAASVARDLFARIEPLISPSSSAHGNSHQDSIGIHSFVSTGMQDASNSSFSPHSVGNTQFNGSDQSYGSLGHASNAWSYKNPAEFVSLWTSYPIEEEYVDNGFEFGI